MAFFEVPIHEGLPVAAQEKTDLPGSSRCLSCAFGIYLMSGEVHTADRTMAVGVINEAEGISAFSLRVRNTTFRCRVVGCGRAIMAFTLIDRELFPDEDEVRIEPMMGTPQCALDLETPPPITELSPAALAAANEIQLQPPM